MAGGAYQICPGADPLNCSLAFTSNVATTRLAMKWTGAVPGQFFFALLNPILSLLLASLFLVLWLRRRDSQYLLLMCVAFLFNGAAFAMSDYLHHLEGPALRYGTNIAFYVAIVLACTGSLMRAKLRIPTMALVWLSVLTAVAFSWYLLVQPSTEARIYVMSLAYALITGQTAWLLVKSRPRSEIDWLFVGLIMLIFLFAIVRPLAVWLNTLDLNEGGDFTSSEYWGTVVAFTPVLAIVVTLTFIGALAMQVISELRGETQRDYLTGLLNRRGFEKQLLSELAAARAGSVPAAVMIADIDDFKKINDTFGHATGDKVIVHVARILTEVANADAIGRAGGEEYALFFRQRPSAGLFQTAENIREQLQSARLDDLPDSYRLTISIGIHVRHLGESLAEMMSRADAALYRAKAEGKDRTSMSPHKFRVVSAEQSF
ncbi:GGDEF domain-containing protein [Devosia sp. RR2S18]|uniref:GGDEF domain-containing protein n=1 Tax=Devosia rhizosphaerae TaxID=3049774 RepID=UPI002541EEEC|nr:GGDEF domain-containing protein [Devosia sp. RR2S18]WIJ23976.1 GGDEF domain-containing protein [Devosia sp. RR2S18]